MLYETTSNPLEGGELGRVAGNRSGLYCRGDGLRITDGDIVEGVEHELKNDGAGLVAIEVDRCQSERSLKPCYRHARDSHGVGGKCTVAKP